MTTYCDKHNTYNFSGGACRVCDVSEALTRALTAQQWAVAILLCGDALNETNDPECPCMHADMRDLRGVDALPAPADLAAELLDG